MKLGIALRRGPVAELRAQVRDAAAADLDAVWIADHMTGFPVDQPVFEPFSTLSALAADGPDLELGIAVTDPFRRPPAVLAQTAMTVRAMTGVALHLGLGAGEAMNLDPFGIPHDRPLRRLRETVRTLRLLEGASRTAPVSEPLPTAPLDGAYLQRPAELPALHVLIGTNGERGRALAAEVADGWLPVLMSPEVIAEDAATMREAAERAGRDPSAFRVVYHCWLGVADTDKGGFELVGPGLKRTLLGFPYIAERLGGTVSTEFAWSGLRMDTAVQDRVSRGAEAVPDDLVRPVAVFGPPDRCAQMLHRFADAGVTDIVFRTTNPLDELADVLSAVRRAYR